MLEILDRLCAVDPNRWRNLDVTYGLRNGDSCTFISIDGIVFLSSVGDIMQWIADMGFKVALTGIAGHWECEVINSHMSRTIFKSNLCQVTAILKVVDELYARKLIEVENA
jgi:hypothetical protein